MREPIGRVLVLLAALGWLVGPGLPPDAGAAGEDPRARFLSGSPKHSLPLEEIHHGGPPVDGIPALVRPDTVSVSVMDRLRPDDRLMVVVVDGVARGYPYRILNWHELVNDRVGSRSVLVTYCPLCGSGVVFDRRVRDEVLTFGVSGLLYQNDVLFYDRRTDSLWSQLEARAVVGPLTGDRLEMVPFSTMRWSDFRKHHPEGEVISFKTGYDRDYSRDPYRRYRRSRRVNFPVRHRDDRVHPKTPVVGLSLDGKSRAYTRKAVREKGLETGTLGESAYLLLWWEGSVRAYRLPGDLTLTVKKSFLQGPEGPWTVRDDRLLSPEGDSYARLPLVESYWFAWLTFHPDTQLCQ